MRYYDVEHLFAQRTYADDPDFDINEALSGSSGPSTDLDWSYQAVWEDQSRLIREVIINGLQAQGLTAIKIKSSFQSFQITATPEVHAAIEQIIVELDEYRNSGWQTKRDIAASARSRQQEGQ